IKPCYVSAGKEPRELEDIVVEGDGFAQLSTVEVLIDGVVVATAPTGSIGEFRGEIDAPYQRRDERPFTLTVQNQGDPASAVSLASRVTALTVRLHPKKAAPSDRVRFLGRGFTAGGPIFGHYVYRGEHRKTVRLVKRTRSDCGKFNVRRKQIPVRRARVGRWTLQVDGRRDYAAPPGTTWVLIDLPVRTVFLEP
ncbi:MAG: hypothetical protein ACRDPC_24365, partial [Solirubrobacteraceae bacterium]